MQGRATGITMTSFHWILLLSYTAAWYHAADGFSPLATQTLAPAPWRPDVAAAAGQLAAEATVVNALGATDYSSDGPRLPPTPEAQIVFPGGGIFFYWQAGAITHLRESERGYDLSRVPMSGASAGALTATLASTGVDFRKATDLALDLAAEAGVWDRPLGLQGVWGGLIERWLDELLPPDAHEVANEGGLNLLITPVPSFGKTRVDKFQTRGCLIRANMASIHIPWFLDGKLTTTYGGAEHIDGSFLSEASDYVIPSPRARSVVTLDWTEDPALSDTEFFDFVKALSKEGIWDLLEQGRKRARVMEERGDFESLPRLN